MSVLKPGKNSSGIFPATSTGVIIDACDYYRLFYETAGQARRYILMTGWQFDTEVSLLRGKDAESAGGEVHFIHFLESLCERNHELEVYILAWDFTVFLTLEREWFQDLIFAWSTNERIHFCFDNKHAFNASHHQKLVIIDGKMAFVGGMDICSSRWDDRYHHLENKYRKDANETVYGPYHDIQSYHTGPIVNELVDIFQQRWLDSGAGQLLLPATDGSAPEIDYAPLFPMPTDRVAISRTQIQNLQPPVKEILEILDLYFDAIMSAERLIYLENQYFSSHAIYWALVDRMTVADRSRLQIIMILPDRLPFTEELFLGLPQMRMLRSLQQVAETNGHRLGVYSTGSITGEERKMTFIHSKLLLVDDLFLTIGSANFTNRSMGLDTELNVTWEAEAGQTELIASIRAVRASLLAEHAGMYGRNQEYRFERIDELIYYLDGLVDDPHTRLCRYEPDASLENSSWPDALEPIARIVDPEEDLFEKFSKQAGNTFAKGIQILNQIITGPT